jgi:hypothetical protein
MNDVIVVRKRAGTILSDENNNFFMFLRVFLWPQFRNLIVTLCTLLSRHQVAGHNHDMKIASRSSENVAQFKYLGTAIRNQYLIQYESKRRLNSGNACYRLDKNPLSSRLLSRNVKIRLYKIIILPVVLYRCDTRYLTLRAEHSLRVFENRVLRRIFGPKNDDINRIENCIMRSFITCALCQV